MCMDIMHFQPAIGLEFLLAQTLRCILAYHRSVMKRYAYTSDSDSEAPSGGTSRNNMYTTGIYDLGGGQKRHTWSIDTLRGMTPKEAAMLQGKINRGEQ